MTERESEQGNEGKQKVGGINTKQGAPHRSRQFMGLVTK